MDHLSLPGVIGAGIGVFIGVLDFGMIASLLERAARKRQAPGVADGSARPFGETVMRVLFVVNALVFAGLGYWFGASLGG
ncbi:MAG: hypothetical protein P4L82_13095 [Ancalomicrobiaceae bacterium]|nr:hypothetical protein [Ancalomicrobiaceae bacterium]